MLQVGTREMTKQKHQTQIGFDELNSVLKSLLTPGRDLFVHSSVSAAGHFTNGVEGVIDSIRIAIGPKASLVMMTDTCSFAKTGRFSQDQPSETGLLTETFRRRAGVRRSVVPMVSFAADGPRAEEYTRRYDSHLDDDATLTRLLANDGVIMMFGVPYKKCTLYHLSEERHSTPYNALKRFEGLLLEDGEEVGPISQTYFVRKDLNLKKNPAIAGRMLEERGQVKKAKLGAATIMVFDARDFDRCSMDALAGDPEAFIERDGS
tara:strand:+ start:37455 stop:38243 length:789 start_codon:yes stop_codon:yes gene_type:complete